MGSKIALHNNNGNKGQVQMKGAISL